MMIAVFFKSLVSSLLIVGLIAAFSSEAIPKRYKKLLDSIVLLGSATAIVSIFGIIWTI